VLIYRRELRAFPLRRHRLRRMHRKLAVIDGAVAFVGGINIVDDLQSGNLAQPRYDYAVRVEGPLLGPILESVHHLWRIVSWARLRRRLREPLVAPARGDAGWERYAPPSSPATTSAGGVKSRTRISLRSPVRSAKS